MKLGLTGGIACGKSTVSDILAHHGAALIDADVIAREVVEPGHPVLQAVVNHFGTDILTAEGTLDRKRLAERIFESPEQRKILESILHPPIRARMKSKIEEIEATHPHQLIVVVIPLLYESGLDPMVDEVMVVYVSEAIQRERLMARDHLSYEQAERRIQAQLSIEIKKQKADVVIDNQGSISQTQSQLMAWLVKKGYA